MAESLPLLRWLEAEDALKRRESKQRKHSVRISRGHSCPLLPHALGSKRFSPSPVLQSRGGKPLCLESGRTKVSRIFRIFVPNFAPNFAPNFPRIFRGLFVLRFVGDGDQKKFTKNPRHFSMQKFPGKHEKNIHKILLESRQSNKP